jgi:hypothetical protein
VIGAMMGMLDWAVSGMEGRFRSIGVVCRRVEGSEWRDASVRWNTCESLRWICV